MEASTKVCVGAAIARLLAKNLLVESAAAHVLDDVNSSVVLPITSPDRSERFFVRFLSIIHYITQYGNRVVRVSGILHSSSYFCTTVVGSVCGQS